MTEDKGESDPFAKAIRKGVLIAQDLEPGMSIMVGGYVFTGKYTTWADQINRALDERIKAERERCAEIARYFFTLKYGRLLRSKRGSEGTRMQSEGPYQVVNKGGEMYCFSVIGPGVDWPDRAYEGTAKRICEIANAAHAEGRKAAEKDFKELLELANGLRHCIGNTGPHGRREWEKNFDAWKKARGII